MKNRSNPNSPRMKESLFLRAALLPGWGNTAIAGHQTMYGGWFRDINLLEPGDEMRLTYRGKVYRYAVERVFKIASNDWSVIADQGYPMLTLTTCVGNVSERLAVQGRLLPEE